MACYSVSEGARRSSRTTIRLPSPNDFHRRAGVDEAAVGHDVDAGAVDLGDARWAQRRQRGSAATERLMIGRWLGRVARPGAHLGVEHETAAERQVRQEAEQHESGAERQEHGDRHPAERTDDRRGGRAGAHQRHPEATHQRQDAGDAGDAEAGNHEQLDAEQHHPEQHQQQLFPAGQLHDPLAPEEQTQEQHADGAGHRKPRRADLDQDAEQAHRHQQRTDDRVGQEAHQRFRPGLRRASHLGIWKADGLQRGGQGVSGVLDHLVSERLAGRQGQQLALLDDPVDGDIGVDHRLGEHGRTLAAFGGGAELLAHVGHRLLVGRLRRAGPAEDRGCRADGAARRHDDGLGGEGDERAGRDRPRMHVTDGPYRTIHEGVAHHHRRVHAPAEGVDVEHHGGGAGLLRLADRAGQERRQAQIHHALDRHDVHDWTHRLRAAAPEGAHRQEREAQPDHAGAAAGGTATWSGRQRHIPDEGQHGSRTRRAPVPFCTYGRVRPFAAHPAGISRRADRRRRIGGPAVREARRRSSRALQVTATRPEIPPAAGPGPGTDIPASDAR
jgi:hypothetical protein